MNEIYVIGHHNPDTDSIVSAMAYAALRNALGDRNYVAAHMDHISDQTQRMLDRFGFQPPRTVQNVRTQVEDLDYDTPPALNATVTMDRAWHIMREQKISAIPVINEDGTLYGTLSAGDIATYSMTTIANPRVEAVPLFNLLSVIEGRLLNDSGDLIDTVSGNVVIALPPIRKTPPRRRPSAVGWRGCPASRRKTATSSAGGTPTPKAPPRCSSPCAVWAWTRKRTPASSGTAAPSGTDCCPIAPGRACSATRRRAPRT